jgi:hypothetical protein
MDGLRATRASVRDRLDPWELPLTFINLFAHSYSSSRAATLLPRSAIPSASYQQLFLPPHMLSGILRIIRRFCCQGCRNRQPRRSPTLSCTAERLALAELRVLVELEWCVCRWDYQVRDRRCAAVSNLNVWAVTSTSSVRLLTLQACNGAQFSGHRFCFQAETVSQSLSLSRRNILSPSLDDSRPVLE